MRTWLLSWSRAIQIQKYIIITGSATRSLGPWGIHVGVWQPHHGGRHNHHAISLQPICVMLGWHAQHQVQGILMPPYMYMKLSSKACFTLGCSEHPPQRKSLLPRLPGRRSLEHLTKYRILKCMLYACLLLD